MLKARRYPDLEKALGYKFRAQDLIERALTHSSVTSAARKAQRAGKGERRGNGRDPAVMRDNERLEFVGDRVLGLAIAAALAERFPEASEGELARRFNRLVCGDACAAVAKDIDLGRSMHLSDSEAAGGGRGRDTILADAMEAVLAAVFNDGGFEKARGVVLKLWSPYLDEQPKVAIDPKTALQEWAQGQSLALPRYVEVKRTGPDHAPHFTSEVRIEGHRPARGEGGSKRIAEQAAAGAFLVREGVWNSVDQNEQSERQ